MSDIISFPEHLPNLSIEELGALFTRLQQKKEAGSDKQLNQLLQYLDTHHKWQSFGSTLNESQLLAILNHFIDKPSEQLSEILIGLQPSVFSNALFSFHADHLALFKNEKLLEPLQYHLAQFIHEGESLSIGLNEKIVKFEADLKMIQVRELTLEQFQQLLSTVDSFRIELIDFLEKTRSALLIGWNTERVDLIEKLSNLNEKLQFLLGHVVGHPASENLTSTGLFELLKKTLSTIYDANLKDEDASLEGLSRLSIWQLEDYWEIGLLPHMDKEQMVKMSASHPQELFVHVQTSLQKLNIGTVADLKRENIFSKDLLKGYILNQRIKLANM